MAGGIILAVLAVLSAAYFSARAYDAHRRRRLARMERCFDTFSDMAQLMVRGHFLAAPQLDLIEGMLGAFRGERRGWEAVRGIRLAGTARDPSVVAAVRAMPDAVLDGLAITIDCYYGYVSEVEPIAGFFIRRARRRIDEAIQEDKQQGEARAISAFQSAFNRRHPTPA